MKVFISHSHKDKDAVARIVRDLSTHGVQAWHDMEQIVPGEQLVDRLNEGIDASDAVVIIISKNTDESRFQNSEIAFAVAAQRKNPSKRIVPVLLDKQAHVPFFLNNFFYCDLSEKEHYRENFEKLLLSLTFMQPVSNDLTVLDKKRIEALAAEREILKQDVQELANKTKARTLFVSEIFFGFSAALLFSTASWLFSYAGLSDVIKSKWGYFGIGIVTGIVALQIIVQIVRMLQKKSSRGGIKDAKR